MCFSKLSSCSSCFVGSSACMCTYDSTSMGAGCACAVHARAESGAIVIGVARGGISTGCAVPIMLSTAGSTSAQVAEPVLLLLWRQALEGVDRSANNVAPVDVWRIAVYASLVLGAAAEEAGQLDSLHFHGGMATVAALVAAKGLKPGACHVPQPWHREPLRMHGLA